MTKNELETIIKENKIVLFVNGTEKDTPCNLCKRTINEIKYNKIMALFVNVAGDKNFIDSLSYFTNFPQTPFLFIKGKAFGGFSEIDEAIKTGELNDIIK